MSIFSALYSLLISPLELFFEIVFSLAYRLVHNSGLAIIFLSLAMNFLVLPLYRRADALQAEERETEERLGHWVKHIKKTFSGDERYMMLQTYYRQNNYKPSYALKGSVSLLLEIPFFIAAYNFLSGLSTLQGISFGPIKDLGAPDAMLSIAGLTINVLPILMTAINLVSGAIYTKGLSAKSKVQLYVMAGLFLVLLYKSPAGLVFYWTLNNVFSLLKNIFYKLKNPKLVLCLLSSLAGAAALILLLMHPMESLRKQIILIAAVLMLQLPLIVYALLKRHPLKAASSLKSSDNAVFWVSALLMTVLTGILIPSALIYSSPEEFIDLCLLKNPLWYVLNSALIAAGFFLVWFGIFYKLANNGGKRFIAALMAVISGISLMDYLFFGKDFGNISPSLAFEFELSLSTQVQIKNLLLVLLLSALILLIFIKKQKFLKSALALMSAALVLMSANNIFRANSFLQDKIAELKTEEESIPSIPLSTEGKNVIVLMMDRAIGSYVPYIINEKPEILQQFEGFTYYPNTISYGAFTNFGTPGLYGGYEYIPEEMNKRSSEPLSEKHNEALKIMPVIFDEAGFDVTVCNPSYAGYSWIPDLSIYDDYPDIRAFNTSGKLFNSDFRIESYNYIMNRNLFCYSLFKIAPSVLQPTIYSYGHYCSTDYIAPQMCDSIYTSQGENSLFLDSFNVLLNLPQLTEVSSEKKDTFLMMSNDTTHEPMLLKEPEYLPAGTVDNTLYDLRHSERFTVNGRTLKMEDVQQVIHYHANMASFIQLGKWFDYMRQMDVYDNTRIIIVSDHGRDLHQFDDLFKAEGISEDLMLYNPLLMVKDFDSHEFRTSDEFMTNADTPSLAFDSLVSDPINPFSGKPINNRHKFEGEQHIFTSHKFMVDSNSGNTFVPDGWISVKDNIFDASNWKLIEANTEN